MLKRIVFFVVAVICFVLPLSASDITTVFNVKALLGQYAFEKESGSYNGNLNIDFVPAIKFSDKFSLLPAFYLGYNGVKDVTELVGGGTLVQQSADYNIALKPIINLSKNVKLRAKVGYMNQLFQETTDETWGKGLFDYNKVTAGADISHKNITAGYSCYTIVFPNYNTLAETETKEKYGSELSSSSVGKKILDFSASEISAYGKIYPLDSFVIDWSFGYNLKSFADQKVITEIVNVYKPENRADNSIAVSVFPSIALIPAGPVTLLGGLNVSMINYNSTQNHYNVKATSQDNPYTPKYYDYSETQIAPVVSCSFNTIPLKVDLSYQMGSRKYTERLAQDSAGTNLADKTKTDTNYLSLGLTYPLFEKMSLKMLVSQFNSVSNMKYEQVYRYNYTTSNYFVGVTYEY
ncbi:MAG: hypothetical protein KKH91_06940 [Elusimicrobia bacterium]|nr:hypothetical protein [Elusimicrobiota bacterium]MBU2614031.1 hypothetical protein [Elusimicrobiota bacterium]